jgi:CHAT domain
MIKNSSVKKILILSANPLETSRLRLDKEVREIDQGLNRARQREQYELTQKWAVRTDDIRRALLDIEPQFVHFCGHGDGENGLVFEAENGKVKLVTTNALAGLFELCQNHVKCVILNACYSEVQAEAISQHIDYVIGMKQAIGDEAAIKFAIGFYDAIGAGRSVEDAYKFGCNAIELETIPEHLTPVLKKRANGLSMNCKKQLTFVLTGTLDSLERSKLEAIVAHLRKLAKDADLTIIDVQEGSIKLILEGSQEGLERLETLFKSGELSEVLGISVEDIYFLTNENVCASEGTKSEGNNEIDANVKELVKSILGQVWRVQYRALGDASVDKLYDAVQGGRSLDNLLSFAAGGSAFDMKSAWELLYQAVGLTVNVLTLYKIWKQEHNRPPSKEELSRKVKEAGISDSYERTVLKKLDALIEQVTKQ